MKSKTWGHRPETTIVMANLAFPFVSFIHTKERDPIARIFTLSIIEHHFLSFGWDDVFNIIPFHNFLPSFLYSM
jgi:hypothetical protein